MKRIALDPVMLSAGVALSPATIQAQKHIHLHVSNRWDDCSFQLDPSLTQKAWRQFTREAGLVAYLRPLSDAKPLGAGKYEVSVMQWETSIDDSDPAWNDTFVHPDSTHWLIEGPQLVFPGIMLRAGVTSRTDVGFFFAKNPEANYGATVNSRSLRVGVSF